MGYLKNISQLRNEAYTKLRKERLAFEKLMSKRLRDDRRTFLEQILENQAAPSEVSFSSKEVKRLVSDVAFVCFRISEKMMECAWPEMMKCLRHSRYAVIQAPRKWEVYANQEESLKQLLTKQGFIISANGLGQPTIRVGKSLLSLRPISKDGGKAQFSSPKKKLLKIETNVTVDELKEELADKETSQQKKKMIRAKLRRMGHKGGLRGL
jgi:hypothetical protein